MIKVTIHKAASNLPDLVRQCQTRDEQFHLYHTDGDITPDVLGIPQDDTGEPVAAVISMKRYRWLIGRSEQLDKVTR